MSLTINEKDRVQVEFYLRKNQSGDSCMDNNRLIYYRQCQP